MHRNRAGRTGDYHTDVSRIASLHAYSSQSRSISVDVCRHRDGACLPRLVMSRRGDDRTVDVTLPADPKVAEQIAEALRIGVETAVAAQEGRADEPQHRPDDRVITSREVYSSGALRLFVEMTRHPSGRVLPRLRRERAWDGEGDAVTIPLDALDDVIEALREAGDATRELRAREQAEADKRPA